MKKRALFVITGISGAGKSQALKVFEDFGYFCVDNLPVALLDDFCAHLTRSRRDRKVALGMDIRGGEFPLRFAESVATLRKNGWLCRVLFLEASDRVVIQRFSETRHRHPLGKNVVQAIREERRSLAVIKGRADKIIDTTNLTLGELKEKISLALEMKRTQEMNLSIVSFGYKYGLPLDADLVMDVRFLPNPNYQPKLRKKTGLERCVGAHILKHSFAGGFLKQYERLITSLLPHYIREGKSYLTLAIGCTGGRHRSVFVTHYLASALEKKGYAVNEFHRDISR